MMAKILQRKTTERIELLSLNRDHEDRSFNLSQLEWVARIVWARLTTIAANLVAAAYAIVLAVSIGLLNSIDVGVG